MEIKEITEIAELEAIQPEWLRLWESSPRSTPFQHPDWLLSWWKQFGEGQLWAISLWREGLLCGLAPLFIHRKPRSSLREVLFIGTGISDYLDALFEPGFEVEGVGALSDWLARRTEIWDDCDFQELQDSPLMRMPVPSGWIEERGIQEVCPVLALPRRIEELGLFVPLHQLENLRYIRNRAKKTGEVTYARATSENFDELYQALLRLHSARAQTREHCGMLADPGIQAFHGMAARQLLDRGLLLLETLRIDGRDAAVFYGFASKGRVFYYLGGFDSEFAHLSLGSMIVGQVIENAIGEGFNEFDFLRGRESYKYLWGARDRFNYRRRLFTSATLAYGREREQGTARGENRIPGSETVTEPAVADACETSRR